MISPLRLTSASSHLKICRVNNTLITPKDAARQVDWREFLCDCDARTMIIGRARPFYFSAAVPWCVAENDPPYCSTAGLVCLSIFVLAGIPMYRTAIASFTGYQVPKSNGLGKRSSEKLAKNKKKKNTVMKMRRRASWVPAKPPQRKAGLGMVQ